MDERDLQNLRIQRLMRSSDELLELLSMEGYCMRCGEEISNDFLGNLLKTEIDWVSLADWFENWPTKPLHDDSVHREVFERDLQDLKNVEIALRFLSSKGIGVAAFVAISAAIDRCE